MEIKTTEKLHSKMQVFLTCAWCALDHAKGSSAVPVIPEETVIELTNVAMMVSVFNIQCIFIAHGDKVAHLPLIYSLLVLKYIYTREFSFPF